MTYEEKAAIFERSLAETGNVAEALRAADRAVNSARARRVPAERVERIRQLRAEGRRLWQLAQEFSLTEGYVSLLCRGIPRPPAPPPPPPSPLAIAIINAVRARYGLPEQWPEPRRRGKVARNVTIAGRVAMLALRRSGSSLPEIGRLLQRDHSTIAQLLPLAEGNREVRDGAWRVLSRARAAESQAVQEAA